MIQILKIKKWIQDNWLSICLVTLLLIMLTYHFNKTYNPPLTQTVYVDPFTKGHVAKNGDNIQSKVTSSNVDSPEEVGFSEEFLSDTIQAIVGIKESEIKQINKVAGTYKDSLQLVKEELNDKNQKIKYYESKDSKGRVVGNAKSTEDGLLVYKGDIDLTTIVKKGETDKNGKIIIPDKIFFYDPTQRVTINKSNEYSAELPVQTVKVKKRITFSTQIGTGVVIPEFKTEKMTFGGYGGVGVSINF